VTRAALAVLLVALAGCTTTRFEYTDPVNPERSMKVERTTFLRQGSFEMETADGTWARIKDDPLSERAAWLAAGLGCIGGAIAGVALGPAGSIVGCLGVGTLGAGMAPSDAEQPVVEEAPPIVRPSERPTSRFPIDNWQGFDVVCGGLAAPSWCVP
jgi:hypothetical protein